jgi:exodeoxyribonuclease V alpha subunit
MARPQGDARIEGELREISYRTDDNRFAVGEVLDDQGRRHTVVGPIGHLAPGAHLILDGRWSEHPKYGKRFKVQAWLVEDPRTRRGLELYLAGGAIKGLGRELARRIVDQFGLETLRILEETPERLREVMGIGVKRLEEIITHWEKDRLGREVTVMLRGHGLGAAVTRRVLEAWGSDAIGIVQRDPYRLAAEIRGVAFRTADTIALANGLTRDDPRRAEAAVSSLLQDSVFEGHTYLPQGELVSRADRLGVPRAVVGPALDRLALQASIVRGAELRQGDPSTRPVSTGTMHRMECQVAAALLARCRMGMAPEAAVLAAEGRVDLALGDEQRDAVMLALGSDLCVITGGPGTGKTTIVKVLVAAAALRGETWALAAPTGRAAQRLGEACGQDAKTIHRLLEFNPQKGGFQRKASRPLDSDLAAVLIDEVSMVDLPLLHALTEALPPGCRLVLVGDADQLPSVGPGQVLADLVASGIAPVARLRQVYRQAEGSGIVRNAHRILRGEDPVSAEQESGRKDFYLVHRNGSDAARDTLLEVVAVRLPARGFDPLDDVQVLTPMHKGPLGSRSLNLLLRDRLNPDGEPLVYGGRTFRVGDRVLQIRNDYDLEIFNGDVGRVLRLEGNGLVVAFGHRELALVGEQLERLELAYAISIHKSQGSEYPAVVVILDKAHHIMLRRSLVYTAVTRARDFCCVLGGARALRIAVGRAGRERRWTGLARRLAAGKPGLSP